MTKRMFESYANGHIHHLARFTLHDGSTIDGFMQPWDDEFVYTTDLDGKAGQKIALQDIRKVSFPND